MLENILELKIFQGIERDVVEKIILLSNKKQFKVGEIIIKEGDKSNGEAYIIKSGSVKIILNDKKIAELHKGDIVGEIALLNEENRTATVTTIEDTELIVLTLGDLVDMINNDDNSINKEIIRRIEENLENS